MKRLLFAVANTLSCLLGIAANAQNRPAITGIAFARFYAADPIASERFYAGTLGLQKISAGSKSIYPVNSLQWVETVPLPNTSLKTRMSAVGFTTRDVVALERYLKEKGVAIENTVHDSMFSVRDPEGNQVWFVQTGSNRQVLRMQPSPRATSSRLIHVGYVVNDANKESAFYETILGFRPYWHGGRTPGRSDWVSLQVPEGTDWLEYMLNIPPDASLKSIGVQDHFSLGTETMDTVLTQLKANGCSDSNCSKSQLGLDGKVQLNVFDPDLSRIEFMEYVPREKPCCSPIVGGNPTSVEAR
jgi:catechol 2,3-dioxygenase-like lactoylglutathione lyase family enzyme